MSFTSRLKKEVEKEQERRRATTPAASTSFADRVAKQAQKERVARGETASTGISLDDIKSSARSSMRNLTANRTKNQTTSVGSGRTDFGGDRNTSGFYRDPDELKARIDELTKRQSELTPLISGARRGGLTEERKGFEAERLSNAEELKRLKEEYEKVRPVYTNDTATQKADTVKAAESALTQTRESGVDIATEFKQAEEKVLTLEKSVQQQAEAFKLNQTEDNYNRYMAAYQEYMQAAKGYNDLLTEYKGLADSYNTAYDDYSGYMTHAKSDASGLEIVGDTVKAGIGSIARALGSTTDLLLPAELWGEKDPLSQLINKQAEEYEYLTNKWNESIYGRGPVVQNAAMIGKATVEALPNAILAMMSGGTSLAGTGLQAASTGTGIASTVSSVANQMMRNPMYWSSFAQTLGPTYEEAKENGANEWQASATAFIQSALNAGVEVSGGIEVLPAKLKSGNTSDILEWVLSTPEEGIEEVIQRFISGTTDKVIYDHDKAAFSFTDPDAIVNPAEMGKEFAMGTAVGGILGGAQVGTNAVINRINNNRLGKLGTDYQTSAVELIEEGLSFAPESEAYQTAEEVKAKMDAGQSVTDADLGRVVVANERTMKQEERLAQANSPVQTLEEVAAEAVQAEREVPVERITQDTPEAKAATEPLSAKESVPYNVMATDNPVRQAVVAKQTADQKKLGYGKEGMKLFNEIAQSSSMNKTELMVRFDKPYQAGLTGLPIEKANLVNDFQVEAYNAGRLDNIAQMSKKPGVIHGESESGFDFTGAPKSLTQAERNFANLFAKKLGIQGSWDGKNGNAEYNAFFDSSTGGVTFAQDFGIDPALMERLGSEDFMKKVEKLESERDGSFVFYVAHEIATHVATNRAPKEMRAFVNSMYNYLQANTADENLARSKQAFYASKGKGLSTEGAIEEVVADAILKLYDGDEKAFMSAMERIMNGKDERAKKGARMYLDRLKDAIAKLKAWVKKLTGHEARANAEKGIAELEQLRDMFEQAIGASMKAVETARQNPTKQTQQTVGEIKNSIKGMATAAGIDASRDPATGKVVFKVDGKVVTKVTPAHIKSKSGLGGLITTAMDNGFISGMEAQIQYKAAADIMNMIINTQDPEMVWAWVGSSMFSAIKSNADGQYGTTVDFTTVCRKTQDMITAMSKAMMKLKRGLTKDEVTKLQAELIAEGSSVPCPVCYVFSRWAGIGSVLDNMYRWQEKYDSYTDAQLNEQIAQLTEKLGKGKSKDLVKMLREQDEEYDNLTFEKEKLALEKKQLTSKKKTAVKNNDARTLVDVNNRLAEIEKRMPRINKRLNEIKASVAPELAWLMQVRAQPDYAEHGKVRANVLFNLDDAATFAEEFPLAWKYRTSRGPSAGKAILPYSDMRVGDMILGVGKTSADGNTTFRNVSGTFTTAQKEYVEKAIARTKAQNLIGGQRFQSTSDFRYDYALDYLMAFWEAQAIGSKMQTYTKIVEFGDMVAAVGGDFNLSVMPRNKGYITLPNGKNQLVFSSVTGIDFEAAKRSNEMHDNGQLILVGINDQHILAALEDSEETRGAYIGFVIPYHASGASINEFIRVLVSNLGETFNSSYYKDYSDVQSDKERKNATADQKRRNELRTMLLRGKDGGKNWEPSAEDLNFIRGESKSIVGRSFAELREIERKALRGDKAAIAEYESWTAGVLWDLYNKMWVKGGAEYGVRLNTNQAKSVMPHEYWNKTVNRDQAYINGFLFRSYCYNLGLTPRFTGAVVKGEKHGDFTDSKGYWKTLIDRPMYRNDGTYRDQQMVNMSTFNMEMLKTDYAQKNWAGYSVQEPDVLRATRAAERFVESSENMRQYSMKVTDKKLLDSLNAEIAKGEYDPVKNPNGGYIKVYRSFQVIDGKLYAPMNAVDRDADGKNHRLGYNSRYKVWEMATESPEIAQRYMDTHPGERYAKFNLDGVDNATSGVAYNPYLHASNLVLNDQFSAAYRRNLITVECWVPVSEIGAYKAQYAKDATGWVDWKPGGVAGKLMKIKPQYARKLFVSRYMLPVREVKPAEVASIYKEYLDGTDIKVPWNVVTPDLRRELVKAGVPIDYKDIKAGKKDGKANIIRFEDVFPDEAKQYSMKDSDGKTLTAEQAEFFKDSKARDEKGRLLVLYHGTSVPDHFAEFQTYREEQTDEDSVWYRYGAYLTTNKRVAGGFAAWGVPKMNLIPISTKETHDAVGEHISNRFNAKARIYQVYANLRTPLIVDAKDEMWDNIDVSDYPELVDSGFWTWGDKYRVVTTDEICEYAHDNGYDGVIIRNVREGDGEYVGDDVIALSSEQLKYTDNLNPTDNPDIRYSMKDRDYMNAVENGDMETAQRMVDEAAKAAGYPAKLYHGTPQFGFTRADVSKSDDKISFFATDSLDVAETYSGKGKVKAVSDDANDDIDAIEEAFLDKQTDLCEYINRVAGYQSYIGYDAFAKYWEDAAFGTTSMDYLRDEFYEEIETIIQELFPYYYERMNDDDVDKDELYEQFEESDEVQRIYSAANDLEFVFRAARSDRRGNYQLYANTDNLFELDAKGKSWAQIPFDEYDKNGFHPYVNTRQAAAYAKAEGFAGVKISNVFDDGGRSTKHQRTPATVYIFFKPQEQVKSADPVTYDDAGNVIPLSKRFDSSNEDIRYSLKGERAMRDEINRIRTEGEKAGKSESEIEDDIMAVVGPEYGELIKTYGEIKRGERPAREIEVPRKTEEDRHVSQTIRTVLEAEATPEAAVPTIQQMIAEGDFSYDVITDKAAMAGAEKFLRSRGYATALAEWMGEVKAGKVSKANTAIGWALYNQAANEGDLNTAMTILNYMVGHQRNAAQAVQATRILKKMTPDAQLYGVVKSVQALEEQLNEGKKDNPEEAAEAAGEVGKAKKDAADAVSKAKVKRKGKRVEVDSNMVGEPFVFEYAQKVGEALAAGLEKRAKQNKQKERTFLQEITAQLNRFAAEKFAKEKKGKTLAATDLLRDYIQNQSFYAEAWQAAQIELREKFADNPIFNEFINSGIGMDANTNPQNAIFMRALVKAAADSKEGKAILCKQSALGFTGMANTIAENLIQKTGATGEMADTIRDAAASYVYDKLAESEEVKDTTFESWINSAMKDIGLKLSDVVMNGTGESAKQAIVDKLVSKYGFGYAEATHTADVVAEHFDRMSRKFAENRLKAMFSDRQNVRRTIPEQIERLARLGAFDVGSAYNQKAAERIFKTGTTLTVNEDLAREFLKAKTQEERDRILADIYRDIGRQMPSTFVDKWNAWRYLAMLGNPRTHVRNILGNAFFAPVVATKDLTATAIESMVGFVSRGKMGRTKAMPGRELLKAAWADYANVADEISGSGKYSDAAMKNKFIEEGRTIFKTKALEKARKGNSAALEMEDMWFAQPHYAFALAQYCKAHGVTADQLRRGKALGNARAYAIKEAQKATYRDTNAFSETISELGRYHGDNKVKKGVSVAMEGALPFRKTPANILVRGLEYSPMGLLKSLTWDMAKVKKGDITAAEAIDNVAAGLTGTGLLALGIYLAAEGLIRGRGGDDEDEKKFEEMQGHQAYALELPDGTSVTLDWLAPEALPMFVGVNLYEMRRDNKGKSNLADILTAVSNVTEPLLEMSCLQSLNDVFDSVGYASTNGMHALPSVLTSLVTSYLTQAFPTILGQAERSAQDVRMTTYTEKDGFLTSDMQYTLGKISARLPGFDFQQIPYVDAWGRTESTGSRGENIANNFLNPAYMSQIETSAMEEELQRLYEATGEKGVLPDRAGKYFTVAGERKDLTAEEYVEYATERGQLAYDLLTDLITRNDYQNADDAEKQKAVERAYEYATAIAKTKVSDYEPTGWVAKAIAAEKFSGMDETEYMLYKLALDTVDQPNENGEMGSYSNEEKSAAIALRGGMSNADIAAVWDTEQGYELYDAGIDMRAYVEYIGTGGSVNTEKLIDLHSQGIAEETYFDFLDTLKEFDQPTESGKMGSFTQDEATAAIKAMPGLSRDERAALWQSVNKSWKAKNNPWR